MRIFVSVRGREIVSFNNVLDIFNDSFILIPVFKKYTSTTQLPCSQPCETLIR